ncbi:ABC transporter ATP-binding protein [Cetobacterium sp. 2G large]|uniref:ABC transporter ATP-binding protein n=1 Tax=Cetobacterium sp. 2G large TaxID=2759680 RepID=UPI00163BB1F6|nr:ATP-binding cassette domain-containing protein [Cetobacterium sp. 2G large]MBC2852523.1 ATP-binding cassette domain-containing protein [Cetobacterium sp. 2G large]
MSYLKINNIRKKFGKIEVLKDINLEIEKGEFICFLGPSGCGKTTLLRIIAGLEKCDSGTVYLGDKNITNASPSQRNLSMVFQSYALFPNMTVYQNIEYGLKNKMSSKEKRAQKIKEVLGLVGLLHIKDKYPDEMSGGQQQRVSLARALAMEPNILLLDEPLSALDAKVREKLRFEIKELQKKIGITTIMVTHDQEEALTMGDKIIVMNGGEIVQNDTPEVIYNKPKDIFVADFIGKINFITKENGEVISIRPEQILYSINSKENYVLAKIEDIEFRGAFYRVTLKYGKEKIILDIISKDIEKVKNQSELYISLN